MVPLLGICVENNPNIFILWPYYKNGSLYDFLHVQNTKLELKTRLVISKGIALGLNYLHSNSIYHFHLSSKNIYLDDNFTPLIADYGFKYLKDISSVFLKYKNKNSYTSPELLKENKEICNLTTLSNYQKCDIYSYGILLWELYTSTQPFSISLTNLYNYVVVNDYRPEITKDFPSDLANLIRNCWDNDPTRRPSINKIVDVLDNLLSSI